MKLDQNGCRKCGSEMLPSKDFANKMTGINDFTEIMGVTTINKNLKRSILVNTLKCSKCQWTLSISRMTNDEKFALID